MTEKSEEKKEKRERGQKKNTSIKRGLTKWHGKREASELIRNTKERARWRSMITDAICHIIKLKVKTSRCLPCYHILIYARYGCIV